jgi:hypothetical protein
MGYEDAFYKPENIVGYTGSLGVNPTVYFESADKVGRITQEHPNSNNVGRNIVRNKACYTAVNALDDSGYFHAQEQSGKVAHTSRNPLYKEGTPVVCGTSVSVFKKKLTNFERSRLAVAIQRFPDLKAKYLR